MESCLVCKELVNGDYEVQATHKKLDLSVTGSICRLCYNKLVDSFHGMGLSKLVTKVKRSVRSKQ